MQLTRRTFLRELIRTGGKIGLSAGVLAAAHALLRDRRTMYPAGAARADFRPRLIRPPGAVDESALMAGCIRCTRCQDACQIGAVQLFDQRSGERYYTPYVDPAVKGCNLCMKCTKACPAGVLKPMEIEDKDRVDMATVELRADLCLSHKAKRLRDEQAMLTELGLAPTESRAPAERRGPCGECYMFCPLRGRAIKLEPGMFLSPKVYPENCVGCGMCEEICRVIVRGEPAIRVVPTRKET